MSAVLHCEKVETAISRHIFAIFIADLPVFPQKTPVTASILRQSCHFRSFVQQSNVQRAVQAPSAMFHVKHPFLEEYHCKFTFFSHFFAQFLPKIYQFIPVFLPFKPHGRIILSLKAAFASIFCCFHLNHATKTTYFQCFT